MRKEKFYEITNYIGNIIKGTEFENKTYCVGGAIRSLMMNQEIKDIDIVVELPEGGVRFTNWLKDNDYCNSVNIFETYGTAMCHLKEFHDYEIECCMTRGEKYVDSGSRNPTVKFAPLNEDAFRRDLTINALYYNISTKEIIDPTGRGKEDIENGIIRTPMDANQTFIDDPLRIMRCVRFQVRTNFEIDQLTYQSMKDNIDRLEIISKERIQDEFNKILMCKKATTGIRTLVDIGAIKYIIPEVLEMISLQQNEYHFGDVFEHTMALIDHYHNVMISKHGKSDLITLISMLCHDIGKIQTRTEKDGKIHFYDHEYVGSQMVEPILKRLKYDNDTIKEVQFLVKNHMRTKQFGDNMMKMKEKSFNKLAYECGCQERYLRLADVIEADNQSHKTEHNINGHFMRMLCLLPKASKMFNYKLPVNGNDVMEVLKIKPGKEIKVIMERLLKMAFKTPEITKEQCLKQMEFIYKQYKNETKKC